MAATHSNALAHLCQDPRRLCTRPGWRVPVVSPFLLSLSYVTVRREFPIARLAAQTFVLYPRLELTAAGDPDRRQNLTEQT